MASRTKTTNYQRHLSNYHEYCNNLGEDFAGKDLANAIVFTKHAASRSLSREIEPWKVFLTIDNPTRELSKAYRNGKVYRRWLKTIGTDQIYVSTLDTTKKVNGKEIPIILVVSVGWRVRDEQKSNDRLRWRKVSFPNFTEDT